MGDQTGWKMHYVGSAPLTIGPARFTTFATPAVKLDVCRRPGNRRDEQRFEFYVRADEEVEEIVEVSEGGSTGSEM